MLFGSVKLARSRGGDKQRNYSRAGRPQPATAGRIVTADIYKIKRTKFSTKGKIGPRLSPKVWVAGEGGF